MSFTENKLIVDLNSNCHDCSTQKTEEKLHGFWQTDMVEYLIDERKLSMILNQNSNRIKPENCSVEFIILM